MSLEDKPREIKVRDRPVSRRCSECASADTLNLSSPPMFHLAHPGLVCGARMPDGTMCQCGSAGGGIGPAHHSISSASMDVSASETDIAPA